MKTVQQEIAGKLAGRLSEVFKSMRETLAEDDKEHVDDAAPISLMTEGEHLAMVEAAELSVKRTVTGKKSLYDESLKSFKLAAATVLGIAPKNDNKRDEEFLTGLKLRTWCKRPVTTESMQRLAKAKYDEAIQNFTNIIDGYAADKPQFKVPVTEWSNPV